jgi:retron-type reverse transcriptase
MQHKLATWAESDQNRKFDRLLRLIADRAWLAEAARIVLASSGANTPGIDGMDKRRMQAVLAEQLASLRTDLLSFGAHLVRIDAAGSGHAALRCACPKTAVVIARRFQ